MSYFFQLVISGIVVGSIILGLCIIVAAAIASPS